MTQDKRFDSLPDNAILRIRDVMALTNLARSSIYREMERGRFPKQFKITAYAAGWRLGDVRQWLAAPAAWRAPEQRAA